MSKLMLMRNFRHLFSASSNPLSPNTDVIAPNELNFYPERLSLGDDEFPLRKEEQVLRIILIHDPVHRARVDKVDTDRLVPLLQQHPFRLAPATIEDPGQRNKYHPIYCLYTLYIPLPLPEPSSLRGSTLGTSPVEHQDSDWVWIE